MSETGDTTLHEEVGTVEVGADERTELHCIESPDPSVRGQRLRLRREEALLLGRRVERGGVSIEDPRLSRLHARIGWDGRVSSYRIGDVGSANGIFVNGERVTTATLSAGSVVRAAGTVFVVVVDDPVAQLEQRLSAAATSGLTVLVHGETGTGKELLAKALHERSGRRGPFLAVNCAALPRELLASELFGHTRAAFSGAGAERAGLFRSAQGGTLFLDEIGDMPLDHQPVLLRALQERAIRPVGGEREIPVDVRVVAATHRNMSEQVALGAFRLDLYARLAEVELHAVPLRERAHRLPELLRDLGQRLGIEPVWTADALERLALAPWPGNVRELAALLSRLKLFGAPTFELNRVFLAREAPQLLGESKRAHPERPPTEGTAAPDISREALEAALLRHERRVAEVARELGTSRTQVYRWLKRFGLSTPSARPAPVQK